MSISTFNGLNVALRGLLTQQRALDVTSHNIANANTEGYTRQEAVLHAEEPLANVGIWGMIFPGQLGQGVTVDSYRRIRDVFNDTELRSQLARQSGAEVRYRELSGIETAIPEPGENGIQALMTKFFANWQDVANNPENLAARQALAQQAQSLASAFNSAWTALSNQRASDDQEIGGTSAGAIGELNQLTAEIATLNDQIGKLVMAGAVVDPVTQAVIKPGQAPNDLLDRRDLMLDKLAKLTNITSVTYDDRNRATVVVAGITAVTPGGGQVPITRADIDTAFTNGDLTAGRLQALEDAYVNLLDETSATSYPGRLNALAQALHDQINTAHANGIDLAGAAGGDFFDLPGSAPPGAAARIRVAPGILNDARTIAAGTPSQGPGSNGNALAILALRSAVTTGGTTFEDFYSGIVTGVGAAAQDAERSVDATGIVVSTLESRRSEVSGVSLDEEMTNMLRFQHAYSAAARVLTAMDENLSRLINQTGKVGM